ncbi:hypothetical protein ACGFZJ_41985 [Streptomyces sp. NPDC048253]|jgi:DNA end-binding protein Ku|uniref:hypothetical protein n=1 Tax=Streptomyces sp. NPDC048253 TaxID=3365524 RepID=UPI0006BAF07E|nr:hypothetical protein OV320_1292 [Actinobacteria bacterium OV320]
MTPATPSTEAAEFAGKVALVTGAAREESVSKAKASRGEDADVHELPQPKEKTAFSKTAAKKQPAKKSAAKKTSARLTRSA